MSESGPLRPYEEVFLVALRDEKGTIAVGSMVDVAIAGAIVAEAASIGRIEITAEGKHLVTVRNDEPTGDGIVDDALTLIAAATKSVPVATWISRVAKLPKLRRRVAESLCEKNILRSERRTVLLVFPRTLYHQPDSRPKRRVVERLRRAIFSESLRVDPEVVRLVGVCDAAGILTSAFDKRDLKTRREQVARLIEGDLVSRAMSRAVKKARDEAASSGAGGGVLLPILLSG